MRSEKPPVRRPPRDLGRGTGARRLGAAVILAALLAGVLTSVYIDHRFFPRPPGSEPGGAAEQGLVVEAGPAAGAGPVRRVRPAAALSVLALLAVKGRAPRNSYDRLAFGEAWLDVDGNGCDTRNDILRRDLENLQLVGGSLCQVAAGRLADPYTGRMLEFSRGAQTSKAVQIDHVVALGDAWQKGAQNLSPARRQSLANDPLNLIAVDGPANVRKSDADAATWLPPNRSFRCQYVARQISVKAAYTLWVTQAEKDAMTRVLADCPGQQTLESGFGH